MIRKVVILFSGMLLWPNILLAQGKIIKPIVAWVGKEVITSEEFAELYEFNPQINSINSTTTYFSKLNFLYTLIAYKLWNQNKNEIGVTGSLAFNTAKEEIKKLYVRDALYRENVLNKISISQEELEAEMIKQKQTLLVDYIFLENEKEADNLHDLLQQGFPFDTLLIIPNGKTNRNGSIEIKYGDYEEYVENQLYALKVGDFSEPIQLEDGYYIFYLKNILRKVWSRDDYSEKDLESTKKIVGKRKETEIYNNYMRSILNGLQVDVDKKLFNKLDDELGKIYLKYKNNHEADKEYFHLNNSEFVELESKFTIDEFELPFISFPNDTVSFQKYLRAFFFNTIKLPKSGIVSVIPILNTYVRDFIIKEKLYQIGIAEGLDTLDEVKKYERIWSEFYAFETAKGNMLDTVDVSMKAVEDEIRGNNMNPIEGDSSEFNDSNRIERTKDLLAAESIREQLKNGTYEFARKTPIKINYEILQSLEVTKINSLLIRHMGFGGSITGVPIYTPNYEWAEMMNSKYKNLP